MGKGQEALYRLTAAEARARLARGEITARALLEACLAHIAEREQIVGAWSFLDADAARARADALDRSGVQGPLHGIPIGVKDIIDTARMPTALGSAAFEGRQPSADAACVALLEQAGAIILRARRAVRPPALQRPSRMRWCRSRSARRRRGPRSALRPSAACRPSSRRMGAGT
jgi:hypothetical protein